MAHHDVAAAVSRTGDSPKASSLGAAVLLVACAFAARASADVAITETVLQSLAGRSSRFTQVILIRGWSMRVDATVDGAASTWIYDAAAGTVTRLDLARREAHVQDSAMAATELERQIVGDRVQAELTATGRTRTLVATDCTEYGFVVRIPLAPDGKDVVVLQGETCIATSGPGLADYLEFQRRAAEKQLFFNDRGGAESGDPRLALALTRGHTELRRRIAALGGMPLALRLTVRREEGKLLALVDQRLHGIQRTTAGSVTTGTVSAERLAIPADWTMLRDGREALQPGLAASNSDGRINLLGRRFWLGLGAGVSALDHAAARLPFGSAHWQPVIRLVSPLSAQGVRLSIAPVLKRYGSENLRARVIAPTAGLSFNLAPARKDLVPFGTLRTGPYFVSMPGTSTRACPGATLELGLSVRRHFVLTGGYEFIGARGGLDLSNWSLNVIFRVL